MKFIKKFQREGKRDFLFSQFTPATAQGSGRHRCSPSDLFVALKRAVFYTLHSSFLGSSSLCYFNFLGSERFRFFDVHFRRVHCENDAWNESFSPYIQCERTLIGQNMSRDD